METLEENVGGLNSLSGVEDAGNVVVDGLLDGLAFLERLHLLVHELCRGEGRGGEAVSKNTDRDEFVPAVQRPDKPLRNNASR